MTGVQELPAGVRVGDERLIQLTALAGQKVLALREQEGPHAYLRIGISGGGCNGLTYKMRFVQQLKQGDIVVHSSSALVVVDSKSALYLKGTVLDYSTKMVGGGFQFANPNAKGSCSCGESFNL